jgi:hypothetical protein
MMRFIAVLAGLAGMPAFAQSFDGLYRPLGSSWDCQSVGAEGGALAVQDGMFYGVENACKLTNPTRVNGMNAVLFDAECNGEGEAYFYRMMLMQLPGGIAVITDGSANEYERCN